MGDVSEYMTLLEAAGELGVSKSRVEQFIRDGRLAVAHRVGRVRLLSRTQVAEVKKLPRQEGRPRKSPDPPPPPGKRKRGGK